MATVECSELVVRYGSIVAVDRVSFQADVGEVVAVLGPNGAGKTSTIETLEGYRIPDGGEVRVLGLDPGSQHRALVGRIGVMLQRGGVYPMLSPRRVLELFSGYYAYPEPVHSLLTLVGLGDVQGTPYRHLSGGEQQRLSLALALIGRPEVVFLDEPTAGVDPEGRVGLRNVIADLKKRGTCVFLTTHELSEAERMADRLIVLNQGHVVGSGTVEELARSHIGMAVIRFSSAPGLDVSALGTRLGAPVFEDQTGAYRVEAAPTPNLTAILATWLAEHAAPLLELRTTASLEETYLSLVGSDLELATPSQET